MSSEEGWLKKQLQRASGTVSLWPIEKQKDMALGPKQEWTLDEEIAVRQKRVKALLWELHKERGILKKHGVSTDQTGDSSEPQCVLCTPNHNRADLLFGLAHELWAAAQLMPGEGIEDGVDRIAAILCRHLNEG